MLCSQMTTKLESCCCTVHVLSLHAFSLVNAIHAKYIRSPQTWLPLLALTHLLTHTCDDTRVGAAIVNMILLQITLATIGKVA